MNDLNDEVDSKDNFQRAFLALNVIQSLKQKTLNIPTIVCTICMFIQQLCYFPFRREYAQLQAIVPTH